METNRPHITPQGFIGVFIVLLGIVFTLDNLGLVQSRQVLQYWPLAPLGIGLLIVIHANETRDWIRGTIWLAAGSLLLARNLGWLTFRIEAFWPLLLVFFGLHIIFKAREEPIDRLERRADRLRRRQERWQRRAERWQEQHPGQTPPWGDWGSEWTKQWTDKWNETQTKFHDDWQQKFHERFHEDWQDKLKTSIQNFATGKSGHDVTVDVNVPVDVGQGSSSGAPSGAGADASASAASAAGAAAGATGGTSAAGTSAAGTSAPDASAGGSPTGKTGAYGFASSTDTGARPDPFGDVRTAPPASPHRMSMFALMSGVTRRIRSAPFYGAHMTAVMGGIELDLRQAQLPDDAVIELFAFWGGIEIWVPREWSVVNQGFALMGSIEDKTGNLPQRPGQPRLVLRGMALMGGVEIKN